MLIAIPKERRDTETRVAASPDTVKKFVALGCEVVVESGAGEKARFTDDAFVEAGARIAADEPETLKSADIVLKVQRPLPDEVGLIKKGALLVGILSPFNDRESVESYANAAIDSFAMEFMPRITRAQSMDVLSSQSNLAGYKAVIDAADHYGRAMPMMMTAAGSIAPARVFVLGAGVAGLQAIATAKRLGAIVSATDVRPAVKEQVESLGGSFVMVEDEESAEAETSGGYAKEMSEDYQRRQAELVSAHLAKQDIAICTALIPGRPAPELISEEMARSMKPGSVIVDLAAEQGGNCALTKPGEIIDVDGVTIIGRLNVPGTVPTDASALYSKNLLNFLTPFINEDNGALEIDWDDEVITGTCLTRDGSIVHASLTEGA